MSAELDKAGQIGEAQKSKKESEIVIPDSIQKPAEVLNENEVAEDEEEEEIELTEEEKAKIEKVANSVNDRCFIMANCLEGAIGVVLDCVDGVLAEDKRSNALDLQSFQQFGPMPPDIQKCHVLQTAAMLAVKIFESIVPAAKPK